MVATSWNPVVIVCNVYKFAYFGAWEICHIWTVYVTQSTKGIVSVILDYKVLVYWPCLQLNVVDVEGEQTSLIPVHSEVPRMPFICFPQKGNNSLNSGMTGRAVCVSQSSSVSESSVQGGSKMIGTDVCVNKPHCAAAVWPWKRESTLSPARVRTSSVLSRSC
jgi:hypothetical protein